MSIALVLLLLGLALFLVYIYRLLNFATCFIYVTYIHNQRKCLCPCLISTRTYEESSKSKKIIESAVSIDSPPVRLDIIDDLAPLKDEIFDIGLASKAEDTPEESEPLDENELADIRVFKFPGKFNDLKLSALNGENKEELEGLYNKVMLTLNHGYQKSAGMVGVAYQTAMSGLEGMAKMTSGLVLLDSLSTAMAKNEEITDILTQINIEISCYNSFQSPKLQLAVAKLNTVVQVHLLNTQLRNNPKLVERLRQQQQPQPLQQPPPQLQQPPQQLQQQAT